jgi:bifunctional Delta-12/omega-3 fatty acid desaturase
MDKDLNYVPLRRDIYAAKIGLKPGELDELGEDAPLVLFLRILLQQVIGWNWYILSNITCPPTALIKQGMSIWRHSHFDPWGSLFRTSEMTAIILSDIGCLLTITALYQIYLRLGSFEQLCWLYIVPWMWVNHWIGMSVPYKVATCFPLKHSQS